MKWNLCRSHPHPAPCSSPWSLSLSLWMSTLNIVGTRTYILRHQLNQSFREKKPLKLEFWWEIFDRRKPFFNLSKFINCYANIPLNIYVCTGQNVQMYFAVNSFHKNHNRLDLLKKTTFNQIFTRFFLSVD